MTSQKKYNIQQVARRSISFLLFVFVSAFSFGQTTYYVDDAVNTGDVHTGAANGVDAGGCGGTGNPCATIQYVLDNNNLGTGDIIQLDVGTFSETGVEVSTTTAASTDDEDFTIQGVSSALTIIDAGGVDGSMFTIDETVYFTDLTLQNSGDASPSAVNGGAVKIVEASTTASINLSFTDVVFDDIRSQYGGIHGTYIEYDLTITDCEFKNCYASSSSPVLESRTDLATSSVNIIRTKMYNNDCGGSTGGSNLIYFDAGTDATVFNITNCLFYGNTSTGSNSAIVFHRQGIMNIFNCTFADNSGSRVAGVWRDGGTTTTLNITNSVFSDNSESDLYEVTGDILIDYCLYETTNGVEGGDINNSSVTSTDFLNPNNGDYSPLSTSSAINFGTATGAPTDDFNETVRSGNPDAGAFEGPTCTHPTIPASYGSFTNLDKTTYTLNWVRGNGDQVLVVAKSGSAPNDPVGGTDYTANAAFTVGNDVGASSYVVYEGTGTSVDITGLTANTTYYFEIWEFTTASHCYRFAPESVNQSTANNIYYVDNGDNTSDIWTPGVTGVDAVSCGTVGSPCRTLEYILNDRANYPLNSAADLIRIDAGTYTEDDIAIHSSQTGFGLVGAGTDLTVFDGTSVNRFFDASTPSGTDDMLFRDFTVKDMTGSNGAGIQIGQNGGQTLVLFENMKYDNCDATSTAGGAIQVFGSFGEAVPVVIIRNCEFLNCTANNDGGAVHYNDTEGATIELTKSKFYTNNTVQTSNGGSAVCFVDNDVSDPTCNVSVTNCLFYENVCAGDGALFVHGVDVFVTVKHCTFADNTTTETETGGIHTQVDGTINAYNTCVSGNDLDDISSTTDGVINTFNCQYDAKSVAAGSDSNPQTGSPDFLNAGSDDYSLGGSSVCTDNGLATVGINYDIIDRDRDVLPDIGCYEGPSCTPPTNETTALTIASVDSSQMTITWTKGTDADGTLIVVKEGSAPTDPGSTTSYTANATFTVGDDVGGSSFVVYKGALGTVTVLGLDPNVTYYVEAWSYKTLDDCFISTNDNTNGTTALRYHYVNDTQDGGETWCAIAGNDGTGDGSAAAPYATIQACMDKHQLSAGDVIRVDKGTTYAEDDINPQDSDDDFTIQGADTSLTVLDPAGATSRCFYFSKNGSVTLQDFTIKGVSKGADGAGIYFENNENNTNVTFTLTDMQFIRLKATGIGMDGGALWLGDVGTTTNSSLVVTGGNFHGNEASGRGAAFHLEGGSSATYSFSKCTFYNNGSTSNGSAIYILEGATSTITNCLFYENSTGASADGTVYYFGSGTHTLMNCTFADNIAGDDGGVTSSCSGTVNIKNCIFNANQGDDIDRDAGTMNVEYTLYSAASDLEGTPTMGAGNVVNTDAKFTDNTNDNYHLLSTSPAVDVGDATGAPTTDLDGATRTDPDEDMGCYEGDGCSIALAAITQASGVNFTSVSSTGITINWTGGSGAGVTVIVRESSATVGDPVSYIDYTGVTGDWSAKVGGGSTDGGNSYVVYQGAAASVALTNLTPELTYFVEVWEHTAIEVCYKETPATASQATLACNLVWNGATTDWAAGTNWTPNQVPTNECNVTITTSGSAPIISAADVAICKSLHVNTSSTLTFSAESGSGGSFQVWGDIVAAGTGKIASGASLDKTLELHGVGKTITGASTSFVDASPDLTFEQKASGSSMTLASSLAMDNLTTSDGSFSLGAGTFTLTLQDLTLTAGVFNQGDGTVKIADTFTTGGTFTVGTGTTHFNGTTLDQTIPPTTYNNLIVDSESGRTKTLGTTGTISVGGHMTLQNLGAAGGIITTADPINITGAFNLGATGNALTFNITDAGSIDGPVAASFTMGNVSGHQINITYDHATTEAIADYTSRTFYGTVTYNASLGVGQRVMEATYNNLVISGSDTRTTAALVTVANDATLNTTSNLSLGALLDINNDLLFDGGTLTLNSQTTNIAGDFVLSLANGGTFTAGTGTVLFDGGATQYVNVTTAGGTTPKNANITFYNMTVSGTDVRMYCDIDLYTASITNTLNISGTLKNIEK